MVSGELDVNTLPACPEILCHGDSLAVVAGAHSSWNANRRSQAGVAS